MCPEGFYDDNERRYICTDTISNVGEETSFVTSLERDLRVETGHPVCAFMQADTSCEMFARTERPRNGSELYESDWSNSLSMPMFVRPDFLLGRKGIVSTQRRFDLVDCDLGARRVPHQKILQSVELGRRHRSLRLLPARSPSRAPNFFQRSNGQLIDRRSRLLLTTLPPSGLRRTNTNPS